MDKKLLIIQPFIPSYREDFFINLSKRLDFRLLCVEDPRSNEGFLISNKITSLQLKKIKIGRVIFFNIFNKNILNSKKIIITWNPNWLSIFPLLLLGKILKKKIFLWTHGISIKNYHSKNGMRNELRMLIFRMAHGICYYTSREMNMMSKYLPKQKLFYVNNTLNVEKIIEEKRNIDNLAEQRIKYGIKTDKIVIFCARFIKHRRADLLLKLIDGMKEKQVEFIIIGDGNYKPSFSNYDSVHDFGLLYDEKIKSQLFAISTLSFQPAWSGLSVVESMANGVPYVTLKRSKQIYQCVEYNYIKHNYNGFIGNNLEEIDDFITSIDKTTLNYMSRNCTDYIKRELTLSNMVDNFISGLSSSS